MTDTVVMKVPSNTMFIGSDSGHAFLENSFDGIEWLAIIRIDLGDTLKVTGSFITDIIRDVNDHDLGLIIEYQPEPKRNIRFGQLGIHTPSFANHK